MRGSGRKILGWLVATALVTLLATLVVRLSEALYCAAYPASVEGAGAGGETDIFDPAKVWRGNLGTVREPVYTAVVFWHEGIRIDAKSFLTPEQREKVTWREGGQLLAEGRLAVGCCSKEDHVRVISLRASRAQQGDAVLRVVVVPQATRTKFASWLEREQREMDWIANLPPVYASLGPKNTTPEPETCRPRYWPVLRRLESHYHPGAAYEMRSKARPDGSGHQATYDGTGKLLRLGVSAGSADRESPSYNPFRLVRHAKQDVIPFVWAAQLDGNPVNPRRFYADLDGPLVREGEHIQAYLNVRPAWGPDRRELPPGTCAEGRP